MTAGANAPEKKKHLEIITHIQSPWRNADRGFGGLLDNWYGRWTCCSWRTKGALASGSENAGHSGDVGDGGKRSFSIDWLETVVLRAACIKREIKRSISVPLRAQL